jgi:hypothetical protein
MVLVSLLALPPHLGHLTSTQDLIFSKGDKPFSLVLYDLTLGNVKGKSFSLNGTLPHLLHLIIGIGSPQNLWREKTQSRIL